MREDFKIFEKINSIVAAASVKAGVTLSYIWKLMAVSLISSCIIIIASYKVSDGFGITFLIGSIFGIQPLIITYLIYGRLSALRDLGDDLISLKAAGLESYESLSLIIPSRDEMDLSKISNSDRLSVRQVMKIIPIIKSIREKAPNLINPEALFTILSVTNPLFGLAYAIVILPVIVWAIAATIMLFTIIL